MLRPIGCNLLPMVDTVANRQEVCAAWCVTPTVMSYEYCIGALTGFSLYGINVDDVVLRVIPCPSGWQGITLNTPSSALIPYNDKPVNAPCCLPTDKIIVGVVSVLCGVCARCLCGPCRGIVTTVRVVEAYCFFDTGKSFKKFPDMIEGDFC